ncbi:hypothetical protein C5B42_00630 [Candidatus Cerribacteria bacterium 'Amazon FNV 2010 28 9']|uniref:Uncharacterized protein n=1 Tax=Candidatus Cerribacteria bacterium 'Amazon FNV 2010 28 9' TaxID=2081795 RepID=A0A317JRG0_9BACT|nr:MAG: hypothetical protein C5B42_00630 [Candidatus Cerribacteria bacterium 'Amazon FNV 2010 28 9']
MKKALLISIFSLFSLVFAAPVFAADITCNNRCQVDQDCGAGYGCFVGVCRAVACPSSTTCGCAPAATTTPVVTPLPIIQIIQPTSTPKATIIATASARVQKTPTTGFDGMSVVELALGSGVMGLVAKYVAESNILKPLEFEKQD